MNVTSLRLRQVYRLQAQATGLSSNDVMGCSPYNGSPLSWLTTARFSTSRLHPQPENPRGEQRLLEVANSLVRKIMTPRDSRGLLHQVESVTKPSSSNVNPRPFVITIHRVDRYPSEATASFYDSASRQQSDRPPGQTR